MEKRRAKTDIIFYIILSILAVVFLAPVIIVLMNSFKGQFYISDAPFEIPTRETLAGLTNYVI